MSRIRLLTVVFLVLAAGCATKGDLRDLQTEVRTMSDRQERLLRTLEDLRASALDSLAVQSDVLFALRGELNRQVLDIQEQLVMIQELTGQSQRALAGLRDQIETRRTAITQQERDVPGGGTPGGGAGDREQVAGAGGVGGDPQELYNVALSQFNRGSITTARAAFQRFLTQYPNSSLIPDAHFYLADIQLQENRLEEARDSFLEIAELFPASDRVPPALYRAAVIEDELGNVEEAEELLERVVNSYPDSGVAMLAEERLDELR